MRDKRKDLVKKSPPMKRSPRAKSIMVDDLDSNPRKPKRAILTRTLRGVRR